MMLYDLMPASLQLELPTVIFVYNNNVLKKRLDVALCAMI